MRARKRFGQHFLEGAWADKVVEAIAPTPLDRFVEIGPGPGALTLRLARRVAHLTAVEVDRDIVARLAPQLPGNVTLVEGDFLEMDPGRLFHGPPVRVAGNLPYNLSSPIIFRLLEAHRALGTIADATLMVQREVAERVAAPAGGKEYGVLSILVQLHADVDTLLQLPPGAFRPVPKVRSTVIRLRFRPPAVGLRDEGVFTAMVRSVFTQRRKRLSNALKGYAQARGLDAARVLEAAGIDGGRRAEALQLTELARLADVFASANG
jgi:16S rRNA (adenine1518-N6/adenine1519-N6)-dimethyltransferase